MSLMSALKKQEPYKYEDQWIKDKHTAYDQGVAGITDWQNQRMSAIQDEQRQRDEFRSGIAGLQTQFAGANANLQNLQRQMQSQPDWGAVQAQQSQQARQLWDLQQAQDSATHQYNQLGGLTSVLKQLKGSAPASSSTNRAKLQTGSLNV